MDIMIKILARVSGRIMWMWNHAVSPVVNINAPIDAVKGHGLISTCKQCEFHHKCKRQRNLLQLGM